MSYTVYCTARSHQHHVTQRSRVTHLGSNCLRNDLLGDPMLLLGGRSGRKETKEGKIRIGLNRVASQHDLPSLFHSFPPLICHYWLSKDVTKMTDALS
jgi:hypothetical protein